MDRVAWRAVIHGVAKSRTRLNDWTELIYRWEARQMIANLRPKILTHLKRPWCWERLKAEGEGDDRRWDGWLASLTQWTMNLSRLQETVKDRGAWHAIVHGVEKSRTRLGNWTATVKIIIIKRKKMDMIPFFMTHKHKIKKWNRKGTLLPPFCQKVMLYLQEVSYLHLKCCKQFSWSQKIFIKILFFLANGEVHQLASLAASP